MNTYSGNRYSLIATISQWQIIAQEFDTKCEAYLWSNLGKAALRYLHNLGLNDETLRKYHVGYNPTESFQLLEAWGLPLEYNFNRNPKKVWLPSGITIPTRNDICTTGITIRRYLNQAQILKGDREDIWVRGGEGNLFWGNHPTNKRYLFLVENEFDIMLLDQCAADIIDSVAPRGNLKYLGLHEWRSITRFLLGFEFIMVPMQGNSLEKNKRSEVLAYSNRLYPALLPEEKCVNKISGFHKNKFDLRAWVENALTQHMKEVGKSNIQPGVDLNAQEVLAIPEIKHPPFDTSLSKKNIPSPTSLKIVYLNERGLTDSTIMPKTPCYCCNYDEYVQRPDGGWFCSICHPIK